MQSLDEYDKVAGEGFLIRPMRSEDLADVLLIEQHSYSHPWNKGAFRDCDRVPYERWVLEWQEKTGGYAIILPQVDELHLLNLCVAPGLRGRGLARTLLRHVIARAQSLACTQVILEVRNSNKVARRLYESEGFARVGVRKGYYPDLKGREDAHVMALATGYSPGS